MDGLVVDGNPGIINGPLMVNGTLKAMLQQSEQTTQNSQLDGRAHGMCDEKMEARHVDDEPQCSFVNYMFVAKEGHMGGMLEVDKQVVRSPSTIATTNSRVNQAPHSKVFTLCDCCMGQQSLL